MSRRKRSRSRRKRSCAKSSKLLACRSSGGKRTQGKIWGRHVLARTIKLEDATNLADLPAHLANCLQRAKARTVKIDGEQVTFVGGAFRFASNLNVLSSFGFGSLFV